MFHTLWHWYVIGCVVGVSVYLVALVVFAISAYTYLALWGE